MFTNPVARRRAGPLGLWLTWLVAGCGLAPCDGCAGSGAEGAASKATVEAEEAPQRYALRYKPRANLEHTVHMVYELYVPGSGLIRTTLSDQVHGVEDAGDSVVTDHELTHYQSLSNGDPLELPDMVGMRFREVRRRDGSFVSTPEIKSPTIPVLLSRSVLEYMKIGTLIVYPERSVSVGDSWTLPPHEIEPVPTLRASLRSTFTLEAVEDEGPGAVAVIASEMEIDISPTKVAAGITSKGAGNATGRFRVRLSDGVLLEATTELHLSNEVAAEDGTVIGFQVFPGSTHVWVDTGDTLADPTAHPFNVHAPGDDPRCALALSSMRQRMAHMPRFEPMLFGAALAGVVLPVAEGGAELGAAGGSLVAYVDGSFLLDERPVAAAALPAALAAWARRAEGRPRLYVYAPGALEARPLLAQLKPVARKAEVVFVVRDPAAAGMLPSPPAWFLQRAQLALLAPTLEARSGLAHDLFRISLGICPPAMVAYQAAVTAHAGWQDLREALPGIYETCGCGSTDLNGLESALYALGGTPDLRFLPLPEPAPGSLSRILATPPPGH